MEVVVELGADHEDAISEVDHVMVRNPQFVDGSLAVHGVFLLPIDLVVHVSAHVRLPHRTKEPLFSILDQVQLHAGAVLGRCLA